MRRIVVAVLAGLFLHLALPSPAQAWWEFLEELSGPGRFYGWDVQLRFFCLVDKIESGKPTTTHKRAPTAIGVVVSACPLQRAEGDSPDAKYVRRVAFDVGARFLWADDNPQFANGKRISLTTLEPSVSINLLSKYPDRDFVDYGFGAGVYWFSSTEFPSFSGAFLEPVRFEFHATSKLKEKPWAAAIPAVRVGYLVFPSGFETAKFGATPDVEPRISRDWAFKAGIFFDLEGLFQ